jgi:hypothetical protein
MTLTAVVGQAQALDGREAGLQATHKALNQLGASAPNFGIVISSHQYQPREVAAGITSLTGDMPLIGFSAPAGLTRDGIHPHSVVVARRSPLAARLRPKRTRDRQPPRPVDFQRRGAPIPALFC